LHRFLHFVPPLLSSTRRRDGTSIEMTEGRKERFKVANKTNSRMYLVTSILLLLTLCTSTMGKTIYVDDDTAGAKDGSSWLNAYNFLQDALADANSALKPVEIRVAQGIYKPDQGVGITVGDREASFQLIDGVSLKGGYAGLGEPDPNARDITGYETILSGDLNGDDGPNFTDSSENTYHIVIGSGTDETAVLDGLTVVGGNADHHPEIGGGGMYNDAGSPTVTNCTFRQNSANWSGGGMHSWNKSRPTLINCTFTLNSAYLGGGMCNNNSDPTLINCIFRANSVDRNGGGMDNSYSSPTLSNCTFIANSAYNGGGMVNSIESSPILTNCTFSGNSADSGGGIYNYYHTNPTLNNCTFSENSADENGGGMYNHENSDTTLNDCIFIRNSCGNGGGGIWNSMSDPKLFNCTFSSNHANFGGGMVSGFESKPILTNCTFSDNHAAFGGGISNFTEDGNPILTNCILWSNTLTQLAGDIVALYSDVQGGWIGQGNIDIDPLFAKPGYWADVNYPNIVLETNGPNAVWVDGDYHLKSQAGRWDPVSESWVQDDVTSPCIDAGDPNSDWGEEPWPHGERINMGAYGGTAEASMSLSDAGKVVYIQWLGHSSVKTWTEDVVVYVDPRNLSISPHDATLILVTHTHGDHYQPTDIAKVSRQGTGQVILPGQTIQLDAVSVTAVPAYNINKPNHQKANNWIGYIIEIASKRIYVAGDTDLIPEMQTLGKIDVAFLPAGGAYTMNATEAAQAAHVINPTLAIPYHWGTSVGTLADAQLFTQLAACNAKVMSVGEIISSEDWLKDFSLIAHWKLDEAEGTIAHDSAGSNDGTLIGNPTWQPTSGKIDGALQLDGDGDYVSMPFVLNPADGKFSVFAWVKGGDPDQVIISQADGVDWLLLDASEGKLMTSLSPPAGRFAPPPLTSEFVITDVDWHLIGFVWDGSNRILYVNDVEVAKNTQTQLAGSTGGLYIGAGKNLDAGSFFSGLIDDVRIYNRAVTP